MIKACADCRYSLKEDQHQHSPLVCYNPDSSHTGGYWTECMHARDFEYGLCGEHGLNFKPKKRAHLEP